MPWPKGKPRKGHVNKDGTAHAAHGAKIKAVRTVKVEPSPVARKKRVVTEPVLIVEKTVKAIHGETTRPIIEPCPNCSFAYADGQFCPSCGWSGPIRVGRVS